MELEMKWWLISGCVLTLAVIYPLARSGSQYSPSTSSSDSESIGYHRVAKLPFAADFDSDAAGDRLHTFQCSVPSGATVLIGSLDQSARIHPVRLSWVEDQIATVSSQVAVGANVDFMVVDIPTTFGRSVARIWQDKDTASENAERLKQHTGSGTKLSSRASRSNRRRFCIPYFVGETAYDRPVEARELASGRFVKVYVEDPVFDELNSDAKLLQIFADQVIHLAEQELLAHVDRRVGPVYDLDGDGVLSVVLCSLSDPRSMTEDHEPITGCVRADDFRTPLSSFGGDIIYIDRQSLTPAGLRGVLAHEMTHAAVFSSRLDLPEAIRLPLPGWINEAMAHVVELEVSPSSPNLASRFERYQKKSWLFPVVIPDGASRLSRLRGPSRAAGCSFLQYALEECQMDSLQALVAEPCQCLATLEKLSDQEFRELFRGWSLDQLHRDQPHPIILKADTTELKIAGTAFARLTPTVLPGTLQIEADEDAQLQVTIVSAERKLTELPSRSRE